MRLDCVEVVVVWRDNTAEIGVGEVAAVGGFCWTGEVDRDREARWDMVEVVDTVIVEVAGV